MFVDVTPGKYALSAFQDTDGDGKLKLGTVPVLGRPIFGKECPLERVGTYRSTMSKPVFDGISFDVPAAGLPKIKLLDLTGLPVFCAEP